MKRDLLRMFQRQGLKPMVIPLVVMFRMLFVFYQYIDDYVAHRDEAAELALRLDVMEATFNLSKNVDAHNSALKPEYASIEARAYRALCPWHQHHPALQPRRPRPSSCG